MVSILHQLRAMGEETRLRILLLLSTGELTVGELVTILDQSQPRVSRHIKLLVEAGLTERHQEGTQIFNRLARNSGVTPLLDAALVRAEADGLLELDQSRLDEARSKRTKQAAEYFAARASSWNQERSLYVDEAEVEQSLLSLAGRGPVRTHLDIGTGTGKILSLFAKQTERSVGIDISREMLAVARSHLAEEGASHAHVQTADMYHLPRELGRFDLITIHMVLHYADQPERVLSEARKHLSDEGALLLVDYLPHDLEYLRTNHAHYRLGFDLEALDGMAQDAGLKSTQSKILKGDSLDVFVTRMIPKTKGQ